VRVAEQTAAELAEIYGSATAGVQVLVSEWSERREEPPRPPPA
jgi:hypothetical protein